MRRKMIAPLLVLIGGIFTWAVVDNKTPRQRVVSAAKSQLGDKTAEEIKNIYWADCLPKHLVDFHPKHWCGCFALWALHKAGIALNKKWEIGKGLGYLPSTKNPLPGDIAYIDQPWQHHAIVEKYDYPEVTTIDGNAPGVKRITRDVRKTNVVFYSIQPLIEAANA